MSGSGRKSGEEDRALERKKEWKSFEEMGKWSVNMEVGGDAVAVITIDNAPVNSLAIPGEFSFPFNFFLSFFPCMFLLELHLG